MMAKIQFEMALELTTANKSIITIALEIGLITFD